MEILKTNELLKKIQDLNKDVINLKKIVTGLSGELKKIELNIPDNNDGSHIQHNYNYIIHEGVSGCNNASISQFDSLNNKLTSSDLFFDKNFGKIGDIINDVTSDGEYIYVVVSGSKTIIKMNYNCEEIKRFTFGISDSTPRCIAIDGEFVYITQYNGRVVKLNAKDLSFVDIFVGGDNLEGIVEYNGMLYIANSYKEDTTGNFIYNHDIFVVDAETMSLINTIKVIDNPINMYVFNDMIYVCSAGNYSDISGGLQIIDTETYTSKLIKSGIIKITNGFNRMIYGIKTDYDVNWNPSNSYFIYDPFSETLIDIPFLSGMQKSHDYENISLLEVDLESKYVYIGVSDHVTNGTIYKYNIDGLLEKTFDSGGINPIKIIF